MIPDVMHDILEGVLPLEMRLMLQVYGLLIRQFSHIACYVSIVSL